MTVDQIRTFLDLARRADQVIRCGAPWKTIYEVVFETIAPQVTATGISFDCYVPDTSYEEDAKAYVGDLRDKASALQQILEAYDHQPEG